MFCLFVLFCFCLFVCFFFVGFFVCWFPPPFIYRILFKLRFSIHHILIRIVSAQFVLNVLMTELSPFSRNIIVILRKLIRKTPISTFVYYLNLNYTSMDIVFNSTFNNISDISCVMLYQLHLVCARFGLTTSMVL